MSNFESNVEKVLCHVALPPLEVTELKRLAHFLFLGSALNDPNFHEPLWHTSIVSACTKYYTWPVAQCSPSTIAHCLFPFRNLLPISHVCTEDGQKPMVLLPFVAWGNLKLFLRQCKLAEANNPQVRLERSYICWSWKALVEPFG